MALVCAQTWRVNLYKLGVYDLLELGTCINVHDSVQVGRKNFPVVYLGNVDLTSI